MKMAYLLIGLVIIGGVIFYFTSCKSKQSNSNTDNLQVKEKDSVKTQTSTDNPYNGLRELALSATPKQVGITASEHPDAIYGVIMDWDFGNGMATLVSFQDGTTSMYLSSGGGIIGGGGHDNVKNEVAKFISLAQTYLDKATKTDTTPLPDKGCVKFYLLTSKGKFVAQEKISDIENETSKWFPFFEEGNKVITELRSTTEKK